MDRDQGGASANNSSDFVRKLYKMLEESQYETTVRWGDDGESFVVLEIDEFTKNVLPRHFKHSNFASFVRQLNKYDFHKVRQNNEESGPSSYGQGAWEFKHPEFQKNGKQFLDNIRRKAPAPRKTNQAADEPYPSQQMDLLNSQLSATQHQFQELHERYTELQQAHLVVLGHTVRLQRHVKTHSDVLERLLTAMQGYDASNRRNHPALFNTNTNANAIDALVPHENGVADQIQTPLRQARELLAEFPTDNLVDKELEQMTEDFAFNRNIDFATPPNDPNPAMSMALQHVGEAAPHLDFGEMHEMDMVYPIGQTRGIDPINKDHINNIPYSLPVMSNGQSNHVAPDVADATNGSEAVQPQKDGVKAPIWYKRPRVMLVEDDRTCSRIGSRFLTNFECSPVLAKDGLEAVGKMNNQSPTEPIDLVLMDIIMPRLDGVSATSVIRGFNRTTPIVAMTSNIRADDIEVYFRYGMNDVLPKPFTKEGMLRILEKHLVAFKGPGMRDAYHPVPSSSDQHPSYVAASNPTLNMSNISHISAPQSIKDDSPAARSPATSWHSPNSNTIPCPSPTSAGPPDGYNMHPLRQGATSGYVMGNTMSGLRNMESPTPQNMAAPRQGIQHRRVMSDMTNGPEEHPEAKRQRLYNPSLSSNSNNFT